MLSSACYVLGDGRDGRDGRDTVSTQYLAPSTWSTRGPFCSAECALTPNPAGVLRMAEAGAYIAELRGEAKPLSRERVRQYIQQGRLPKKMTRADIDAAYAQGELASKPGKRGRLKAPRGWLTTADVADKTGLSTSVVGDLCAKGEITAKKERGGYLISQPALRRWRAGAGEQVLRAGEHPEPAPSTGGGIPSTGGGIPTAEHGSGSTEERA